MGVWVPLTQPRPARRASPDTHARPAAERPILRGVSSHDLDQQVNSEGDQSEDRQDKRGVEQDPEEACSDGIAGHA
jgi:hypothetical protein